MKLIEDNQFIQISEDIWGYRLDCFSGILYLNKETEEISYQIEIMAGANLVESSSVYNFEDAKEFMEQAVKDWYKYSKSIT